MSAHGAGWDVFQLSSSPDEKWVGEINRAYAYRTEAFVYTEWWNERHADGRNRPMSASEFGMEVCRIHGLFGGISWEPTTTGRQDIVILMNAQKESADGELEDIEDVQLVTVALDQAMGSLGLRRVE